MSLSFSICLTSFLPSCLLSLSLSLSLAYSLSLSLSLSVLVLPFRVHFTIMQKRETEQDMNFLLRETTRSHIIQPGFSFSPILAEVPPQHHHHCHYTFSSKPSVLSSLSLPISMNNTLHIRLVYMK